MSVGILMGRLGLVFLGIGMIAGCGDAGTHVTGTVSFDGKPVPAGKIYLIPDDTKGNSGGAGHANIVDGKFDTAAEGGKAPEVAGAIVVGVEGFDPNAKGTPAPGDTSGEVLVKSLFPYYEMSATIPEDGSPLELQVPAAAANRKSAPERPMIVP
jgi:hypothetical protein